MRAAKIRREKVHCCPLPGFWQRNPAKGLPLGKSPKRGLFGSFHNKVPVGFRGTTVYFGGAHRSDPLLLASGSNLVGLFPRHITSSPWLKIEGARKLNPWNRKIFPRRKNCAQARGRACMKGFGKRWGKGLFFPFGRKAIFEGAKIHRSI